MNVKGSERSEGPAPGKAIERLARLDCCAVSDAMDKLKLAGVASGLAQLSGSSESPAGR